MGFLNVFNQIIHALVIKAHSVDQAFRFHDAEQTRFIIARLRAWRHGANFDKAKAHGTKCVDALAVFIQAGGQTQRIFKREPHAAYWLGRHRLANNKF
ncbi:hypothetical protein D3C79_370620 [compost metagenome]